MKTPTIAVIGLTGGIASGKSTVARRLRERGAAVVDADVLAREIVALGSPCLEEIARAFGREILQTDGTLNRGALGERVFGDTAELERLNAITHPAILRLAERSFVDLAAAGHPWAVWEAALILDNDLCPPLAELVVVLCDPDEQIRRIEDRDGLTEADARARIDSQVDNATRRARADVVLENHGALADLSLATDHLFDQLVRRYGAPPKDVTAV